MIGASSLESVELRRRRLADLLRTRNARCRAFPMSFQQRGIWFLEQLHPATPAYHVPLALDVSPPRDPDTVHAALRAVVAHHPSLRTTFGADESTFEPVQRVHARLDVPLRRTDLRALPGPVAAERARLASQENATTPFPLEDGPLIRAHLLELPGGRQRLLVTVHHLVADGWSLHLLMRDLQTAYDALSRGLPPRLAPAARHYHDWSSWQLTRPADHWRPHLAFYREVLAGAPPALTLPTDRPRPAAPTATAGRYAWTVPPRLVGGLRECARAGGTTLYAVLIAALALVLHRRTGQDRVVIGTPVANRTHLDLHDVIGYFVNIGVVPVAVAGAGDLASLLPQVHRLMLGVLAYQDLPFELLVESLAPARSLAVHPVFQVMLALQNTPDAWATEQSLEPTGAAKFDLTFNAVEAPDGLHVACVYPTALFDHATVVSLCDELTRVLAGGA